MEEMLEEVVIFSLSMIVVLAVWMFYIFIPEYGSKRALSVYNHSFVLLSLILSAAWTFKAYAILTKSDYADAWLYLAGGGTLVIIVSTLTVGFLMRNFWIFRPSRGVGDVF